MPIGLHRSVVLCATYMHTCAYIYIYIHNIYIYIYIVHITLYIYIIWYICMKLTIICQKSLRSVGTKAGLFMTTSQLLDQHAPEMAYSVAAGCADVWGPSGGVSLPMGVMGKSWSSWTIDLCGYGSIPINTIFRGMNIHLPVILMFTRYQGFDPSPCDLGGRTLSGYVREVSRTPPFLTMSLVNFLPWGSNLGSQNENRQNDWTLPYLDGQTQQIWISTRISFPQKNPALQNEESPCNTCSLSCHDVTLVVMLPFPLCQACNLPLVVSCCLSKSRPNLRTLRSSDFNSHHWWILRDPQKVATPQLCLLVYNNHSQLPITVTIVYRIFMEISLP